MRGGHDEACVGLFDEDHEDFKHGLHGHPGGNVGSGTSPPPSFPTSSAAPFGLGHAGGEREASTVEVPARDLMADYSQPNPTLPPVKHYVACALFK